MSGSDTSHTAFFGDAERTFRLTAPMIVELERIRQRGIGGICKTVFDGHFSIDDIRETIRLGLVGAGEKPETAASLVAAYATDRPLAETFPLALAILETTWFGVAQDQPRQMTEADEHAALSAVADAIKSEAPDA